MNRLLRTYKREGVKITLKRRATRAYLYIETETNTMHRVYEWWEVHKAEVDADMLSRLMSAPEERTFECIIASLNEQ